MFFDNQAVTLIQKNKIQDTHYLIVKLCEMIMKNTEKVTEEKRKGCNDCQPSPRQPVGSKPAQVTL